MLYDQAFFSKDQDEQIEAVSGSHVYSYPAAVKIKNAVGREKCTFSSHGRTAKSLSIRLVP